MALQELILSSSSTLTCLHDLKTGSLQTSFKGTSSSGTSDFSNDPQASSSSTYGSSNNNNAKGKNRAIEEEQSSLFKKTTDCIETRDAVGGVVASVIAGKAAINIWSYQKEAPMHRLLLPVKVSCLALSKLGTYLVCGTHDGRLFLWETATGYLLASFDGHYRAVTCLAWTDDDAAFISGGDDSVCHVWSLPIVLASGGNTLTPITPYTSLADHTLPITSVSISFGKLPRVRILTSSLDGSCKIWDLSRLSSNTSSQSASASNSATSNDRTSTSPLLSTFSFASTGTTRVTNATWDTLERSFYAVLAFAPSSTSTTSATTGQTQSHVRERYGKVVKIDLYRQVRENEQVPMEDVDEDDEEQDSSPEGTTGRGTGRWKALGGGGRGDINQVSDTEASALGRHFTTSNDYISSISLSHLSSHLIVGTQSGKVHILSLPSMQNIRTIVPSQTSSISSLASPITFIHTMIRPVDLVSRTGAQSSSGSSTNAASMMSGAKANEAEILPRPIAPQLSRSILQPNSKEANERVVNIRLTGNGVKDSPFAIDDIVLPPSSSRTYGYSRRRLGGSTATVGGGGAANGASVQSLQEENARLKEQLARSIAFNDRMWESVVDGTLAKAKEGRSQEGSGSTKVNGMHVD
ncbi:WD40 repeat-like protein [Cystobasidium minutum MCA 4210]|uniref:WD40 repeat-like protein n=1 Tax=Cystobasidium minutum MCA 4210 TaxID=1397322 RepID=UPI0034CD43A6|eukprot:jgi/Rhomi1/211649/estExt_Genemark1.C_5_t10187